MLKIDLLEKNVNMPVTIQFKDETLNGVILQTFRIPIVFEKASVEEIIRTRVLREVEKYNETIAEYYNGLVQPDDAERTLNGFRMKKRKKIDPEKQCKEAIQGFENNAFILLYNNQQVDKLDEVLSIDENTEISFIKLTPLVGG
ncbi:MAG: hypothetical protein KDK45_24405 [Leptospiraceae bacterium]|nr:hypothetical protein [Leptospiraceae bacterium]